MDHESEGINSQDIENPSQSIRSLLLFTILSFIITWVFFIPAVVCVPEDYQIVFIILGAFGPLLAAVVTIRIYAGGQGLKKWLRHVFKFRIPFSLYFAGALFLPVGIGALQFGLYWLCGGTPNFAEAEPWYLYLLYLLPTALLSGGNEEPGWRGFALPALLRHVNSIGAAFILGFIHAAWHLPLMNYYDTTFGWYLFNLIPLTVLLNWFYLISRRSVIPVMLLHAGTNVIGAFIPTPVDVLGGFGTYMVLRGIVYWGMALVLVISTKGSLGWKPDHESLTV